MRRDAVHVYADSMPGDVGDERDRLYRDVQGQHRILQRRKQRHEERQVRRQRGAPTKGYTCTPASCEAMSVTNGTDCAVAYRADTFKCADAAGQCWQDAYCTGTAPTCPANAPKLNTVNCNDNDACTYSDKCDGSGGCHGTVYSCNSPGACQIAAGAVCNGDGTCTYQPDPACADAGTPDAGTDAGTDAGVDAGLDAGSDTGVDAGTDAGTADDIGVTADAGVDAGEPDGGVVADTGIDKPDTGEADAGIADTGVQDSGLMSESLIQVLLTPDADAGTDAICRGRCRARDRHDTGAGFGNGNRSVICTRARALRCGSTSAGKGYIEVGKHGGRSVVSCIWKEATGDGDTSLQVPPDHHRSGKCRQTLYPWPPDAGGVGPRHLSSGMTIDEIPRQWPDLVREDIPRPAYAATTTEESRPQEIGAAKRFSST